MEIAILQEYLVPEVLVLIPVLWLIGFFLKQTPKVPDWLIVWILLFVGILISMFIVGFDVYGIIQGILVAGIAALGYDLFKQTRIGVQK